MLIRHLKQALAGPRLGPKLRLKLLLGAALHPRQAGRWLEHVYGTPWLARAARLCPQLLIKPYRPYLQSRLDCAGRVASLITHYELLHQLGLEALAARALRAPQQLYQGSCKNGESFELSLSAMHEGHREGELCLRLSLQGQQIYALSFVLGRVQQQPCLVVSRLQGVAGAQGRELVREATRAFHAYRPGPMLVTVARQLAQVLGCQRVLLVANRQRISINLWRRWHLRADYDQTWRELGAARRADGWFELSPLTGLEIDYSQVASRKRAEVRKRQAMLDLVHAGLQQTLSAQRGLPYTRHA
nr:DUF535 family protein [uncultured Roseateles sp.]